jgi:hypothetical protein
VTALRWLAAFLLYALAGGAIGYALTLLIFWLPL